MNRTKVASGVLVAAAAALAFGVAVLGCNKNAASDKGRSVLPAERMAKALSAVGWIESKQGSRQIVSPWGKVGEDGRPNYRALLKDKDIQALGEIGITVEQFVAAIRVLDEDLKYRESVMRSVSASQ